MLGYKYRDFEAESEEDDRTDAALEAANAADENESEAEGVAESEEVDRTDAATEATAEGTTGRPSFNPLTGGVIAAAAALATLVAQTKAARQTEAKGYHRRENSMTEYC